MMTKKEANKTAKSISTILECDCTVYDYDAETLYINTGEDALDFARILLVKEQYNIEAINIDDDYEGYLILQIDLRTEEERRFEEETTDILMESEK